MLVEVLQTRSVLNSITCRLASCTSWQHSFTPFNSSTLIVNVMHIAISV